MSLIERDTSAEQLNRLLKALGMEAEPVKKTPSGKVIDTNPIKDRAQKVTRGKPKPQKVTKTKPLPQKAKPSKPKKSTIFGISFKSGGKIGGKKGKKQSGHHRLY